jgi:N6-L-threonylcarbamoyladenine synthase
MDKLKLAKETGINQIAIGGGVSANSELEKPIKDAEQKWLENICSKFEYTTDNAKYELWVIKITQQFETAAVVSKARIKF